MKKRVLKKWVIYLLIGVNAIILFTLGAEFNSLSLQLIISLIGLVIFGINYKIIKKYGNLERLV